MVRSTELLVWRKTSLARKRAEDALRSSEAEFRQVADSMPQLVWVTRPDGYHEWYNRPLVRVHRNHADTSLLGRAGTTSFIPTIKNGAWVEMAAQSRDRASRTRSSTDANAMMVFHRWFLGRALPIRDESGRDCALVRHRARTSRTKSRPQPTYINSGELLILLCPTLRTLLTLSTLKAGLLTLTARCSAYGRGRSRMPVGKNFFELGYPAEFAERFQRQIQEVIEQ